ncbi:hypothetical protein AVEN_213437-1 [Araneus ventricosus]|uniref:Mos1 transposase HTH domain-containing protein n=1 Tax=Araneus ventricosus TaxID=182803 RepID=A0A4Y2JWG6_ARAVE|nr:hypothetical protein AVEN_213437-1 [Araneus ventricosus]
MDGNKLLLEIKQYFLKGKTAHETKAKLDKLYGESVPSIRRVSKWLGSFRSVHMSTFNFERQGSPVKITIQERIEKFHDIVTGDRRVRDCLDFGHFK